ncbi:VOC family protein [Nonomuraea sp. KM90]|uniref:VOC family protein n=1 Tax=Nonomuraea sp. KM90 TaxID=3457428 RepID=UPI003FCCFD80
MACAIEFYEGKLGLSDGVVLPDGGRAYPCGAGTWLYVYESRAHAGKATATVAHFAVDDLERVVDELNSNGVEFERYGDSANETGDKGIHDAGDGKKVAWFKDPDGNTFAVNQ